MSSIREQKMWYLKNFDIFSGIPMEKIDEIAGSTHLQNYKRGEEIYKPGDELDQMYLLKSGEVILYHQMGDKKVPFDTLGPGSLFGGISLKKEKIEHFAEVAIGSQICNFPQKVILEIIAKNPKSMLAFWQKVSERLADYENRIAEKSGSAADLLLGEIRRLGKMRRRGFFGFLKRPLVITHEELARRTGLNRVTVTRELGRLRAAGKIAIDPKTGAIEILSF